MNTKLDNITTQYRKFNENQALTEGQLNEFIDYFEDQDRLSRTRLSGVGIGCGFKSALESVSRDQKKQIFGEVDLELKDFNSITITQGFGITTDGDLITLREKNNKSKEISIDLESKIYFYYREYFDGQKYPHFFNDGKQMPLVELFSEEEYEFLISEGASQDAFRPVSTLDIAKKVVILYLESYSNEESPCEDADCDNNGAEQVSDLKVLLADKNDVEAFMINGKAKDSIYNLHNNYELLYDKLKEIEARRVILNPGITTAVQLKTEFQDAIYNADTVSDLSDGFRTIAKAFNVSLNFGGQTLYSKLNALLSTTAANLDDYQYRYDLLKDLIDTYNEIKGLVLHLKVECCPSIASFPKHLMLGPVAAPLNLGDYTSYRHDFYNSPINTNDDENYEMLISLANRFVQKINGFQSFIGQIKITPSNQYRRLGDLAIPYYYKVNQSLLENWNFEKTQTDKETYNLSYHTASLASDDFVQNPLLYNIDDNDFFRIEGHLGMPYKIALKTINDLKAQYGLAFDVLSLVLRKGETAPSSKQIGTSTSMASESTTISIKQLRDQLFSISSDISNQAGDSQRTLQTISSLDSQLRKLNDVEYEPGSVSVIRQDPKEDDVVSELLSEFLERKSGLEHVAGVGKGKTFVMVYASETDNKVLADFELPYLCCSKKDPVFLVLPATALCQNDAPIPITIIPLDGTIKAFANGTQVNAIKQIGGQNFFDPSLVVSPNLEQPITFTVDDDPVDTQIVVHAVPNNITVTTSEPVYGEDDEDPDATVTFTVPGNLTGLKFTWNFGDGTPIIDKEVATNTRVHTYNLVAGQESIFNPTLTITNANGCSIKVAITPLTLTGQMVAVCLAEMEVIVRYTSNTLLGPPGADHGHGCNHATYELKANDVPLGMVSLNNQNGNGQDGYGIDIHNYPPGITSGTDRYNRISITSEQAQEIAEQSLDGYVTFSLDCTLPPTGSFPTGCHSGVNWTQVLRNGALLWEGLPENNFFSINPCTGDIK